MKAKFLQSLLKRFHSRKKKRSKAGFTLIELLISIMIAAVIISVLLSFVVDLLDTERREYASSETQREMQLALDFIANDLREAVYVYDSIDTSRGSVPALRNFVPVPDGFVPILAFWKSERVPYDNPDGPINCNPSEAACEAIQIRRRAYSLVVYLQKRNQGNDLQKWKGNSRIVRYVLRKHTDPNNPQQWNAGYVDPVEKNPPSNNKSSFPLWPHGGSPAGSLQSGVPALPLGGAPVLVDFVDNPTRSITNLPGCINTTDTNSPVYSPDPSAPQYRRVPSDPAISTSFYACVKTPPSGAATAANQDVIIYLRGNPEGKIAAKEPLVTIQTQAVARGVINKDPQ
ncbi:MAG TPA: hypothetical protein DCY88_15325 [Cyanobacteria bacterium UBA11372]|nr:hypothetical protein [Cyanobacteria bacterium UBA11372]